MSGRGRKIHISAFGTENRKIRAILFQNRLKILLRSLKIRHLRQLAVRVFRQSVQHASDPGFQPRIEKIRFYMTAGAGDFCMRIQFPDCSGHCDRCFPAGFRRCIEIVRRIRIPGAASPDFRFVEKFVEIDLPAMLKNRIPEILCDVRTGVFGNVERDPGVPLPKCSP